MKIFSKLRILLSENKGISLNARIFLRSKLITFDRNLAISFYNFDATIKNLIINEI